LFKEVDKNPKKEEKKLKSLVKEVILVE